MRSAVGIVLFGVASFMVLFGLSEYFQPVRNPSGLLTFIPLAVMAFGFGVVIVSERDR